MSSYQSIDILLWMAPPVGGDLQILHSSTAYCTKAALRKISEFGTGCHYYQQGFSNQPLRVFLKMEKISWFKTRNQSPICALIGANSSSVSASTVVPSASTVTVPYAFVPFV